MFRRALLNELAIMKNRSLLPRKDRKRFFERVADQYHHWRPEGFEPELHHRAKPDIIKPERWEARTFRFVSGRAFRRYVLLHWVIYRVRSARTRTRWALLRAQTIKRWIARRVRMVKYRLVDLHRPLRTNLAVFSCNVFRAPSGNPLAIYRALRELAPSVEAVWVIRHAEKKRVPDGIRFVVDGSSTHFSLLGRARYVVNDVDFADYVVKRPGQIFMQTQNGTPLKTMGLDMLGYPAAVELDFEALLKGVDRWDYLLSSNRYSTEMWQRSYQSSFTSLEVGYPRNDRFYTAGADEVRRIREGFGIPPGKTAILYAPTVREYAEDYEPNLDVVHLTRVLPDDQFLMVRGLPGEHPELEALEKRGRFLDVTDHVDAAEVCLAADVLITDYSSIMFDYANLGRPIVIFADDYETFGRVRGLNFDLLGQPPGPLATTDEELIEILRERRFEAPGAEKQLEAFRSRFCEWDDGHAAERVVRAVFLGEDPRPVVSYDQRTPAPRPAPPRPGGLSM
jgi:CDP-glycerol glycerophosphotransferase